MFGISFQKTYSEDELLKQCQKGQQRGQQALYERYADTMKAVCMRYVGHEFHAEDVLVTGFMKVFDHIGKYKGAGSLEGWIRRIMVNEALMFLRKERRLAASQDTEVLTADAPIDAGESQLHADELMALVQALPDGYRAVFNLYAIEGYSHKEIASMLGISEGTSKSQLSKARQLLKKWVEKHHTVS